jgi:Ran GTPase-activating protein (RanGAP) involved in mRNA processing and transport
VINQVIINRNKPQCALPTGRPEDEALDALRIISAALAGAKLKRLNLSDNALGEKGVRACATVLTAQVGGHVRPAHLSCTTGQKN